MTQVTPRTYQVDTSHPWLLKCTAPGCGWKATKQGGKDEWRKRVEAHEAGHAIADDPDLRELDAMMDQLYEMPEGGT